MAKTATKIGSENVEVVDISLLLLGLDKIKQEANQSIGENEELKQELNSKIDSIVKEKEIKTVNEKINDLAQTISKSPEMSSNSEIGMMAKKIELATEELTKQHLQEVEELKKEDFIKSFEDEAKKINPKLSEDQLKNIKDYGELVAKNSFGENILDDYQNEALETNKEFGPGKLENSWSDLKQVVNFLQKSPEEIKDVKEKYNSIKDKLKEIKLPSNFKEVRSFEEIILNLGKSSIDDLFSKTKNYLSWADKVDKLTGGWLNKTVTKAGQKVISKIGNQTIQEFAKNGLEKIASEGFEKGFTNILKGVLEGGIKTTASTGGGAAAGAEIAGAAGSAVSGAAESAVISAATGTTGGIITGATAGRTAAGVITSGVEVGGTAAGVTGGTAAGGVAAGGTAVSAPAVAVIAIVVIAVVLGLFIYQLFQGSSVSSLVPPKGNIDPTEEYNTENNTDPGYYGTIDFENISVPVCNPQVNSNAILRNIALSIKGMIPYNQTCVKYQVVGPSEYWGKTCTLDNNPDWPDLWGLDCAKYVDWVWYQCMQPIGRGSDFNNFCNSTCLYNKPQVDPTNWEYVYPRDVNDLRIGDILHKIGHAAIYIGKNEEGKPEIMETVNSGFDPHIDILTKIENYEVYQGGKVYDSIIRPKNVFTSLN
ncbi:MAG: hypothetical protein PHE32_00515 [Candidatus Shapirobacteria bacterium]|nr:hypothetical protein [Candidatus Shapirobacteria bacterium]MDD4410179.1 hypothetical protein [Candidatus Shapirobacteria bacterium]